MNSIAETQLVSGQYPVQVQVRIKNAYLAVAAGKLGSQTALGRRLGIDPVTCGLWCNLQACPPATPSSRWPQARLDRLAADLFELTGAGIEDIFPDELRMQCLKRRAPIKYSQIIGVEHDALRDMAVRAESRLTAPHPAGVLEEAELADVIRSQIGKLSSREREVLKLRYGLQGGDSHTYESCSHILRVCKERVRQIEAKAIRKLQQPESASKLVAFCEM